MNDERTTQEVIELLGNDCDRCHAELIAAIKSGEFDKDGNVDVDYGFQARQLIRTIFAYIEALTFSIKVWSAEYCLDKGIDITPQETYFATDIEYELNDRGEIVETKSKIPLARNIRFAFAINRKAHGIEEGFDASVEWWNCLKHAIRVRDRLTHPKFPEDLDVSAEDILNALKAKKGFEEEALRYAGSNET